MIDLAQAVREIPAWVLTRLSEAARDRLTGTLTINFRGGAFQRVERAETFFPPSPPHAGVSCPQGCADQMVALDGGTMYQCPRCGAKRTKAQVVGGPR